MKRGFLFGLGSFFIVVVIAGLGEIIEAVHPIEGAAIALVFVPLSVAAIRAARRAPAHISRLRAIAGWLVGFFCLDAAILAVAGIIYIAA